MSAKEAVEAALQEYNDTVGQHGALEPRSQQRLSMYPTERLILSTIVACGYGFMSGFIRGSKIASLRYLAENAHRLPRTKSAWYFFHKRKNYVVLKDSINTGVLRALKVSSVVVGFTLVESQADSLLQSRTFVSTAIAATTVGTGVAVVKQLGMRQMLRSIFGYTLFGIAAGGLQDMLKRRRAALAESEQAQASAEPKLAEPEAVESEAIEPRTA